MPDQMALFPALPVPAARQPAEGDALHLPADLDTVDQLFAAGRRIETPAEYSALLRYITRFGNYSVFNGFLLFLQDPDATFIATLRTWAGKYRRRPLRNARPSIILAPGAPILPVYDVRQTEGAPVPSAPGPTPRTSRKSLRDMLGKTLGNCAIEGIAVREVESYPSFPETAVSVTPAVRERYQNFGLAAENRYLILLDANAGIEAKYAQLVRELAHLFCGHIGIDRSAWWRERRGLEMAPTEIEAASVGFLVCNRNSIAPAADPFSIHLPTHRGALTSVSLSAVLKAAGHIEEMARREWRTPRRKGRRAT
jgi:hypothetical protein